MRQDRLSFCVDQKILKTSHSIAFLRKKKPTNWVLKNPGLKRSFRRNTHDELELKTDRSLAIRWEKCVAQLESER